MRALRLLLLGCLICGTPLYPSARIFAQDVSALTAAVRAQAQAFKGKEIRWEVRQLTTFTDDEKKFIEKELADLTERSDVTGKADLLSVKNQIASLKVLAARGDSQADVIEITGKFLSATKWRLEEAPTHIPRNLRTVYVADGTGKVVIFEHGIRQMRIERDPAAVLADVLRGEVAIALQPYLNATANEKMTLESVQEGASLRFEDLAQHILVNIPMDFKTLRPAGYDLSTPDNQLLYKMAVTGARQAVVELLDLEKKTVKQRQEWKRVEERSIDRTLASDFTWRIEPTYVVKIRNEDGSYLETTGAELKGKKLILKRATERCAICR